MVIYNVTAHVEPSIEQEWLLWMRKEHMPKMLATKKFSAAKIFKIINEQDIGGTSYAVQYHCISPAVLKQYLENEAAHLRKDVEEKFENRILFFRTELQLIEEQS
jgi:hypothetical protein